MVIIVTDPDDMSSHIVTQYLIIMGVPSHHLYSNSFLEHFDISTLDIDVKRYTGIWLRRGLHFVLGQNWNPIFRSELTTLDDYLPFVFENSQIEYFKSCEYRYACNSCSDLETKENKIYRLNYCDEYKQYD